ncbi:MAG: amidohydrolase family protein [Lentisphaeria bacterium]|nr:amidohydrolase [Lentisphaerota bacterium]MBR7145639.1 amidohydrolase family protein [Lentisphaeria bacterium]
MFIDCHVHALETPSCPNPRDGKALISTPEELLEIYDRVGIEKGVILPIGSPDSTHFVQSNEEMLRMVAKNPDRFIPFCNLDPRSLYNTGNAPLEYVLKYYKDLGCKGVGEVTANLDMDDPRVQNLFQAADNCEIALTFHLSPQNENTYGLIEEMGLKKLEKALQKFHKVKFFGHSQAFWAEISANPTVDDRNGYPKGKVEEGAIAKLMRKYPNLYGDLSAGSGCNALKRDEEYAIKFLNEFQDRLMFGTDICQPHRASTPLVDFMLKLRDEKKISEEVFRKVARENIIRILDL